MKIAWIGGVGLGGGVGSLGTMLMESVLQKGIDVDFYGDDADVADHLQSRSNLSIISTPPHWSWNKWYSKNPFMAFLTGTYARMNAYNRQCDKLMHSHRTSAYDCIFQLSQTELFKLADHVDELPPIVVYPCVHAAGELYWHQRESQYALQSEGFVQHYITRAYLCYRSFVQKQSMKKPTIVIGMSERFNRLISTDYDISPTRQAVLYQPVRTLDVELVEISEKLASERTKIRMLLVARISVRKGIQYIVELSHRLNDLADEIQIDVIGDRSQWSDYRSHLEDLNPRTASYLGGMKHEDVSNAYQNSDILLAPSVYEPGGIVVGEALGYGLCVVASDAIGSAEMVKSPCLREFVAGDMDGFEQAVRKLVADLKCDRQGLRQEARTQSKLHYSPDNMADSLITILERVVPTNDASLHKEVLSLTAS